MLRSSPLPFSLLLSPPALSFFVAPSPLSLSSFLHFLPMSCHFCCPSSFTTSFSTTQSTTNSNFVWASAKLLGQTTCVKLTGTLPQLWSSRLYTYTYDLWCVCVGGRYFIVLFHIYAIYYFDLESAPYFYTLYSIYGNYNSLCVCVCYYCMFMCEAIIVLVIINSYSIIKSSLYSKIWW